MPRVGYVPGEAGPRTSRAISSRWVPHGRLPLTDAPHKIQSRRMLLASPRSPRTFVMHHYRHAAGRGITCASAPGASSAATLPGAAVPSSEPTDSEAEVMDGLRVEQRHQSARKRRHNMGLRRQNNQVVTLSCMHAHKNTNTHIHACVN